MIDARRLGARLAGLRSMRGLSQVEAARELGVTRSTLAMTETGGRALKALELAAMAELYGVGVGEILGEATPGDFGHLCAVAGRLSPEHRDQLVRYARFLKELER